MDKQQIIEIIINIIKTHELVKKNVEINENTSLFRDCGINSIDIIELILSIEEMLCFEFNNSCLELDRFETVSQIADIIVEQLSGINKRSNH